MFPILNIGPLAVQAAPLILILATWLGLTWSERAARHSNVDANKLYNLALIALIAGLLGARLGYAARHTAAFADNWLSVLTPTPAMLDASTGLLAAVLAALVYGQRTRMPLWPTLDALTPALSVLLLGIGFSHLASGAAFGRPTTLPWGWELWGDTRHPAQLYEIVGAALVAVWVWIRFRKMPQAGGILFLEFTALSAALRLFLEYFRADSLLLIGGVRTAQAAGFLILAACLWLLPRRRLSDASAEQISAVEIQMKG